MRSGPGSAPDQREVSQGQVQGCLSASFCGALLGGESLQGLYVGLWLGVKAEHEEGSFFLPQWGTLIRWGQWQVEGREHRGLEKEGNFSHLR